MPKKICCGYVDEYGVTHRCGFVIERNYPTADGKNSHGICGSCRRQYYQILARLPKKKQPGGQGDHQENGV